MASADPTEDEVSREAARPMGFFPHDVTSFDDVKIRKLVRRRGFEGYGMWWRMCELLASNSGHGISVEGEDGDIWAEAFGLDRAGLLSLVSTLEECGLVTFTDGWVTSERMNRNARYIGTCKANGRRGGRPPKNRGV